MNNKAILLALSTTHDIAKLLEKNLEYYGFNVTNISRNVENESFQYPSLLSRIRVNLRKIFYREKEAKLNLKSELLSKEVYPLLKNKEFDYALFFLAQNYSIPFLQFIRSKVKPLGMVNYQWDGINRFPTIFKRLSILDRCYVFDPNDVKLEENILPTTSFYFDFDLAPLQIDYDFYFLGAHREDRIDDILTFAAFARSHHWQINISIVAHKHFEEIKLTYPDNIRVLSQDEVKSFEENLNISRKSKVLLDFVINEHKGLSLRTFEALGHDKKLITTNKEIQKYDFYHPDNIFILDNNLDELPAFLEKPYHPLDPMIKKKYSFGNWIHYVLNIHPHIPIDLPREKS